MESTFGIFWRLHYEIGLYLNPFENFCLFVLKHAVDLLSLVQATSSHLPQGATVSISMHFSIVGAGSGCAPPSGLSVTRAVVLCMLVLKVFVRLMPDPHMFGLVMLSGNHKQHAGATFPSIFLTVFSSLEFTISVL